MQVLVAEVAGLCFGVRAALARLAAIDQPAEVTVHGQLVHNEVVLGRLAIRGFNLTDETDRGGVPDTPTVLLTAHGVSDRERQRLESAGKRLIDTTCPLVARVHRAAQELQADGWHVLVIGRPGHVEVRGIIEDLHAFDVVADESAVRRYPSDRLGVVCQTTVAPHVASRVLAAIKERNPDAAVRFIDTICQPTRDHQRALERLLPLVDVMVVVGGRNSNNTRELVGRCCEAGRPAHHVQGADDLRREWFAGTQAVGITAGTSTLDETLHAVVERLREWAREGLS